MHAEMVLSFTVPKDTGDETHSIQFEFPSDLPNDPALTHKIIKGFAEAWITGVTGLAKLDAAQVQEDIRLQNLRYEAQEELDSGRHTVH